MRVVVDRGDMVLGLDLRGNFTYGIFAALFYIFTLIRIYFIYYFFGLFETVKEVFSMGYSVAIYTDQEILGMKKFVHTWLEVSGNEGARWP